LKEGSLFAANLAPFDDERFSKVERDRDLCGLLRDIEINIHCN